MVYRVDVYVVQLELDWIADHFHKEPDEALAEGLMRDNAEAFPGKLIGMSFTPNQQRMKFYFISREAAILCDKAFKEIRKRIER